MAKDSQEVQIGKLEVRMQYAEEDNRYQWSAINNLKDTVKTIDRKMAFHLGIFTVLNVILVPAAVAWVTKELLK